MAGEEREGEVEDRGNGLPSRLRGEAPAADF